MKVKMAIFRDKMVIKTATEKRLLKVGFFFN